jgi:hypothetical protein
MRPKRSTPKMMHRAGELRKELTPAERKLWTHLRNDQLGVNFRRQHSIGSYIADFCCIQKKLIIELDGTPCGRSISTRKPATGSAPNFCNPKAIAFYVSGTMLSLMIWMAL